MCKWNVLVMILLSGVLAGYAAATTPLVYENFESYSSSGDMYANWTTAGPSRFVPDSIPGHRCRVRRH